MTLDQAKEEARKISKTEGVDMAVYFDLTEERDDQFRYGYCPLNALHCFSWVRTSDIRAIVTKGKVIDHASGR